MGVVAPPDRALCTDALERLVDSCDGINAAMLAMRDGRPFIERCRTPMDCGKIAAMVSSMVALGHTFLREIGAGPLDHVLIDGAEGKLVISSVSGSGGLLLLAVFAERDARLGMVLGHSKTCAQAVTDAFPQSA